MSTASRGQPTVWPRSPVRQTVVQDNINPEFSDLGIQYISVLVWVLIVHELSTFMDDSNINMLPVKPLSAPRSATCNGGSTHRVVVLNFTNDLKANRTSARHYHALCGLHTLSMPPQKLLNTCPSGRPIYRLWPNAARCKDENGERHCRPVFECDMSSRL